MQRSLRSVANYLIVSLAFADLMVACLAMPLGAVYEVRNLLTIIDHSELWPYDMCSLYMRIYLSMYLCICLCIFRYVDSNHFLISQKEDRLRRMYDEEGTRKDQ